MRAEEGWGRGPDGQGPGRDQRRTGEVGSVPEWDGPRTPGITRFLVISLDSKVERSTTFASWVPGSGGGACAHPCQRLLSRP